MKQYFPHDNYITEIIGHPITLINILHCLEQEQRGEWRRYSEAGKTSEYDIVRLTLLDMYDLSLPLEQQSEEVIEFLYNNIS